MFKKLLCFALLSLILFSCSSSYEKVVDGVIIHLNKTDGNARLLKLTVVNDKVIRVSATAADTFSTAKSLVVDELPVFNDWKLVEKRPESPFLHFTNCYWIDIKSMLLKRYLLMIIYGM